MGGGTGEWKQSQILFSWASKSLWTVIAATKLRLLLLGRKAMTNLDSILKGRDITAASSRAGEKDLKRGPAPNEKTNR